MSTVVSSAVKSVARRLAPLLGAILAGSAANAASAGGGALAWPEAFSSAAEPTAVHFTASYRGVNGQAHRLEVWRSGAEFLHRRTDERLDLFVRADTKVPGGYRYRLIDHRRKVMIDVARGNLMRIGVFAEWDGLAHVATPPRGGYRIESLPAEGAPSTGEACAWHQLIPAGAPADAATRICWSERLGLPVRIEAGAGPGGTLAHGAPTFELLTAEAIGPESLQTMLPSLPAGYDYIDSDADIDPAGD